MNAIQHKLKTIKLIYLENNFKEFVSSIFNILIIKRLKKIISFFIYYFSDRRGVFIKIVQIIYTKSVGNNLIECGNYLIDGSNLNKNSIIYSFGIGQDISFDCSIIENFECNVFAYDPTPNSIEFIKNITLPKQIYFYPIGVWSEDGEVDFYFLEDKESKKIAHGSITNTWDVDSSQKIPIKVNKIKTMMNKNNHSEINLIKMDIEGSAPRAIKSMFKDGIYPDQIIVELEFPKLFTFKFLKEVSSLLATILDNSYKIYSYPRKSLTVKENIYINHSLELTIVKY
tara:strand:- start:140 stop:994 length:855 start_codon:yes stop_codon:yes gene_type:complete